jgi:Fe(3+) dicitrate transport protein
MVPTRTLKTQPALLAACLRTGSWNAHVGYAFNWAGQQMKAGLGINNVFNRDYYFRGVDYSQGRMPQPGRAVMATLQVDI